MYISENKLRKIIYNMLNENFEGYGGEINANESLGLDPRFDDVQRVPNMPQSVQYSHNDKKYPDVTHDWAVWEQFPNYFISGKFCWISPENIPDNFILPLVSMIPANYVEMMKVFAQKMYDTMTYDEKGEYTGEIEKAFKSEKTIVELIKMLRNTGAWIYGDVRFPLPYHPELKRKMLPPEWSILYKATERRAEIIAKKIKKGSSGEESSDIFDYATKNGFKVKRKSEEVVTKNLEKFRNVINSVIRDESKHLTKSDIDKASGVLKSKPAS